MADEATVRTFFYEIPSLNRRIETEVLYKARRGKGVLGIDNASIVDAEMLINEYLITISAEVFNRLTSPLSVALEDLETPLEGYEYNVTYTDDDSADHENSIVYRMIFPDTFNVITKSAILRAIEDAIVSYAVYQWLMDSQIQGWEKYEQEHLRKFDDLRLLTTRRKDLRRKYKLY